MIIGYARVSTDEQSLELQIQSLKKYAKEKNERLLLFTEKESGGKANREELKRALNTMAEGDTFVVYKLDRLARSTKQLYELHDLFIDKKVEFVSISDHIDTTTAVGKAMFGMLAVFAEFEKSIIQERTKAGLAAARKRGRVGGRPRISDKTKRQVKALYESGESATDIAKEYSIGRSTVYKILNEEVHEARKKRIYEKASEAMHEAREKRVIEAINEARKKHPKQQ